MKIADIKFTGLTGGTVEGGWAEELAPEDNVHTVVEVVTDAGLVGVGSVFTSSHLVGAAMKLLRPFLIGERAAPDVEARIREEASADADVVEVMALSTMHLGPHAILVTLGIRFRPELTAPRVETAIERLQARITKALEGSTDARLVVIEATRRADTPGKPP